MKTVITNFAWEPTTIVGEDGHAALTIGAFTAVVALAPRSALAYLEADFARLEASGRLTVVEVPDDARVTHPQDSSMVIIRDPGTIA